MLEHYGQSVPGPLLALFVSLSVAGCASTNLPFSNSSDLDRTFIAAAGTWDIDKNGSVSCDEWKEYVSTLLRETDGNGDGTLDAQEYQAMARSDRLFETVKLSYYDANSDGRVTADELAGKQNRAFALLDKNSDCQIDRTETVTVYNVDKPKPVEQDQSLPRGGSR